MENRMDMYFENLQTSLFPHNHVNAVAKGSLWQDYFKLIAVILLHHIRIVLSRYMFSGWNEPWIDILSFSVTVSIYLHYTAMGALSEESALIVSSLSTDLWNNWTKNNAEGISSLFCLSLLIWHLKRSKQKLKQNKPKPKNPAKSIMMIAAIMLLLLEHCWILCVFYLWDELLSWWSLLRFLSLSEVIAATQLG